MRPLLVASAILLTPLLFGTAAADPAPEPGPHCAPVGGQGVFDTIADAVNAATGFVCHTQQCLQYSYGKIALIRSCMGV